MTKHFTYNVSGYAGAGGFPIPTGLLVGGRWTEGADGGRIDVLNPADEQKLTTIADATPADGIAAVDAAERAAAPAAADARRSWAVRPSPANKHRAARTR